MAGAQKFTPGKDDRRRARIRQEHHRRLPGLGRFGAGAGHAVAGGQAAPRLRRPAALRQISAARSGQWWRSSAASSPSGAMQREIVEVEARADGAGSPACSRPAVCATIGRPPATGRPAPTCCGRVPCTSTGPSRMWAGAVRSAASQVQSASGAPSRWTQTSSDCTPVPARMLAGFEQEIDGGQRVARGPAVGGRHAARPNGTSRGTSRLRGAAASCRVSMSCCARMGAHSGASQRGEQLVVHAAEAAVAHADDVVARPRGRHDLRDQRRRCRRPPARAAPIGAQRRARHPSPARRCGRTPGRPLPGSRAAAPPWCPASWCCCAARRPPGCARLACLRRRACGAGRRAWCGSRWGGGRSRRRP